MEEITARIKQALADEESKAERFAIRVRVTLLLIFTFIALINARSVSTQANTINFCVLLLAYIYKFIVYLRIRRGEYRSVIKYITSFVDVVLVYFVLVMYTTIAVPSVALKNYVFFALFPIITLTAFRYDRTLTWLTGGLAVTLYVGLFSYLYFSKSITIATGGYASELFSADVTFIGQLTKVLILIGFVALAAYLAQYTRTLFDKLVRNEVHLRVEKESMERELEIASQVQNELLPHSFPIVAGLDIYGTILPGKFVSGDYYDFLQLSDTSLLLVVADVSGKGVPAALIMSEVRASTHLFASMRLTLEDFAQRLNTLLFNSTARKDFVTFFAAEINTSDRSINYVNSGHPPPLVYSQGGIRSLTKGTVPLGFLSSLQQLAKHSEEFPPGSMIVAYTDGIWERTNSQGEQYGEDRLLKFVRDKAELNAQSFVQQLLDEVKSFGPGKGLDDDVTLAVAKFYTTPGS